MRTIWSPIEEALQRGNGCVWRGWLCPRAGAEANLGIERYYGKQKLEGEGSAMGPRGESIHPGKNCPVLLPFISNCLLTK